MEEEFIIIDNITHDNYCVNTFEKFCNKLKRKIYGYSIDKLYVRKKDVIIRTIELPKTEEDCFNYLCKFFKNKFKRFKINAKSADNIMFDLGCSKLYTIEYKNEIIDNRDYVYYLLDLIKNKKIRNIDIKNFCIFLKKNLLNKYKNKFELNLIKTELLIKLKYYKHPRLNNIDLLAVINLPLNYNEENNI